MIFIATSGYSKHNQNAICTCIILYNTDLKFTDKSGLTVNLPCSPESLLCGTHLHYIF
jgi:hypothetical protein